MKQPQATPPTSFSDTLVGWIMYGAVRLVALIFSRFLLIAILLCILLPLLLITASFANTDVESGLSFIIWIGLLWPWALTGRSHFTEADFDILISGWSALVLIVTFVLAKFFPGFKFPIKKAVVAASMLYVFAAIAVVIGPIAQTSDPAASLSLVAVAYGGFLFSIALFVAFDHAAETVRPKNAKPPTIR